MGKRPTKTKKSEPRERKTDFVPGAETDEQFEQALLLLSEWLKAQIVDVSVDTDGDIYFNLPREMDELLETQMPADLASEHVVAIIQYEIPALVEAGLAREPAEWLKRRVPEELSDKVDSMAKRAKKVVDIIISENLKERILLRRSTPAYVVERLEWNAGTYHVRSEDQEKIDVPFVSLEINFTRPRSAPVVAINPIERRIGFKRDDDISVNLQLHRDDIIDLARQLEEIAEEMRG